MFTAKKIHDFFVLAITTKTNFTIFPPRKRLHNFTKNKTYVHVANLPTPMPLKILSPALKCCRSPIRQELCSHPAHLCTNADFVPRRAATRVTCGALLILSPALKRQGTPIRQGLCSHPVHLWATNDFVPRSAATRPICGPFLIFVPRCEALDVIANLW